MSRDDFHDRPFDDATLAKLRILERYVEAWIPVFLAQNEPPFRELHIFDFFAGPGQDPTGAPGTPLAILNQFKNYRNKCLAGWRKVEKSAHFSDLNISKIETLRATINRENLHPEGVKINYCSQSFQQSLSQASPILRNPQASKLLIIDQFGVNEVTDDVFLDLISFPRTDFIFFLSSSVLHRFRNHPAIKQKISEIDDYYNVHRAVFSYYKDLVPRNRKAYLGQFSIKKGSNIYGLIFGSGHPLGLHKFLEGAWKDDQIAGEANFDVDRENIDSNEQLFPFEEFRPKKIQSFERELEKRFRSKALNNEAHVLEFCIESGMTSKHAAPVISRLKEQGFIKTNFRVPSDRNFKNPRAITYSDKA